MDKPDEAARAAAWARVREIEARIEATRGAKIRRRIETLTRSISMVASNAEELVLVLTAFADKRLELTIWAEDNRGILDAFLTDISRRLHNYVASVMSLVEHNRRMVRGEYAADDQLRVAYEARVKQTFTEPKVAFVQDLRDYTVHYALPPVFANLSWKRGEESRSEIRLDRDALLAWDGWSGNGRRFLTAGTDAIDLRALIDYHGSVVTAFYEWFLAAVKEHHAADMTEMNALIDEMRAAFVAAGHSDYLKHVDAVSERQAEVMRQLAERARVRKPSPTATGTAEPDEDGKSA